MPGTDETDSPNTTPPEAGAVPVGPEVPDEHVVPPTITLRGRDGLPIEGWRLINVTESGRLRLGRDQDEAGDWTHYTEVEPAEEGIGWWRQPTAEEAETASAAEDEEGTAGEERRVEAAEEVGKPPVEATVEVDPEVEEVIEAEEAGGEDVRPAKAFWAAPGRNYPIEITGEPEEGPDGKQYVKAEWWFHDNQKIKGETLVPVEAIIKSGEQVRVKRHSGDMEDDWFLQGLQPDTQLARVTRDLPDGKYMQKDVTWAELASWRKTEDDEEPDPGPGPGPDGGETGDDDADATAGGDGGGGEEPPDGPEPPPDPDEEPDPDGHDADPGGGGDPDPDPDPDPADPIPDRVREISEKHGLPVEYIMKADTDPSIADSLRRMGIDYGAEHPPLDPPDHGFRSVTQEELSEVNELNGTKLTPENIRFAQLEAGIGNLRPADFLTGLGLDLGVPRLDPADPVIKTSEIGRKRLKEIKAIIDQMEDDPGKLKKTLKRPGKLPLGLQHIPLVGHPLAKRVTAWRMVRKELRERPINLQRARNELVVLRALPTPTVAEQERIKELEVEETRLKGPHNDGLLRLGIPRFVFYTDYLNRLDESIRSNRQRLGRTQRHQLNGDNKKAERRNLAYRIHDSRKSVEWADRLLIVDRSDPEAIYDHERYKRQNRIFHDDLKSRTRRR